MSETSKKHKTFAAEPLGEKSVKDLAGIGESYGEQLKEKGFDMAYNVFGMFLVLKRDEELFKDWLKDMCRAKEKHATDCYNCLNDWYNHYF